MRIALLCTDAFGSNGGIALYMRDLITALALHRDCEEVVVLPRRSSAATGSLPAKVTFIDAGGKGSRKYIQQLTSLAASRSKFDLVIGGHLNLLPLARLLSKNPLAVIYGIEAWKRHRRSESLIPSLSGIITISDLTLRRFQSWAGSSVSTFLLPCAIHPERYQMASRSPEMARRYGVEGRKVVMTLGRIASGERYKGFDEIIEVLPTLASDIVYLIAGDGDDRPRLIEKARLLGVSDRVIFAGYIPEEEKAALYSLADVYAMPSRGEGFGFVSLEAMASGLPVIASRLDGGREALREGALGTLVDPSNPAELRVAIRQALTLGKGIPEGLDYFHFSGFVQRTHEIIDLVMAGRQ